MAPPFLVPSKAAIHALRGIALGTSCAIGVIVEDRRRRISTLRTAIENRRKLRSAKQYHSAAGAAMSQLDEALSVGDESRWRHLDDGIRARGDEAIVSAPPRGKSTKHASASSEPATSPPPPISTQTKSSSRPVHPRPAPLENFHQPTPFPQTRINFPPVNACGSLQVSKAVIPMLTPEKLDELVTTITGILASKRIQEQERINRALERFFEFSRIYYAFKQFDEEWIAVSAQVSKVCLSKGRYEDASKVLTTTIAASSLDELQFFAHGPLSIIHYHLRQRDKNKQRYPAAIAAASRLFLTRFKEKPRMHPTEIVAVGRTLFSLNLELPTGTPIFHDIFWRVLVVLEEKESSKFTGWAIRELYRHGNYKSAVKYFLLNFSKMNPTNQTYHKTVDSVVYSVEGLEGQKAELVLRALGRMDRPSHRLLETQWIMRLLRAHWDRDQNFQTLKAFFEEVLSLGLVNKVKYPEAVYRTMVELSIKAGDVDAARSYHEELIQKYPKMAMDVALKGFIALGLAKAGDWDGVFDAFTEMRTLRRQQSLRHQRENEYDDAFVMILKEFAGTHPVAEVRDFVLRYTGALCVRLHPYTITMVANKYGDCHDMPGFLAWIEHCSRAGSAIDSSVFNSLLHNCWIKWKVPYPELHRLYSKIQQLDRTLVDDVTRRIMSQAALSSKTTNASKLTPAARSVISAVNKLANAGRTTNRRDVYEAMNQELSCGKPAAAVTIYKRALRFGMSYCRHCLRLAVSAALQNPNSDPNSAMSLIHDAHNQGGDVSSAVSVYLMFQLEHLQAKSNDTILYMRNLVSQFEALHVVIDAEVISHMARVCVKLHHFERAVALCSVAMDRSGSGSLCFSRQNIRALLVAYSQLLDVEGMRKLLNDLPASEFAADKPVLHYLKSTKRTVQRFPQSAKRDTLLDMLKPAIDGILERRATNQTQMNMISQKTLRIIEDALADMQGEKKPVAPRSEDRFKKKPVAPRFQAILNKQLQHQDSPNDDYYSPLVAAGA
ncbi:hypothetical protein F4677DRAFT_399520 [Hypoxylon crocopeplum]|nr:hypothetical protein F4677DRAFT_399520 [Hypoxylon crocopeplum]